MRERVVRVYRASATLAQGLGRARAVVLAAAGLVLVQLGFRAWALYPSWFYADDYLLLMRAEDGPGTGYLFTPFNGHFMPAARLLVWAVRSAGPLDWGLAATSTLALQALAGAAAVWMLVQLFGARWAVLAPLALYLFGTMTLPALMWWAATLNQLGMQVGFFVAVGAWVRYLRRPSARWLLLTVAAVGFGLGFDIKALLILPVLVFVQLGYFTTGGPVARVRDAVRRYWPAALVIGGATATYLAFYLVRVDTPFEPVGPARWARTASAMVGTAFTTAAVGGPWVWDPQSPPNARPDPPATAVRLAWLVLALVVLHAALRRHRTLRAWALLGAYLAMLLALLVTSRVPAYGPTIGLEYRYLTDVACVLTLAVALAHLRLRGAPESSARREQPLLLVRVPPAVVTGLTAAFVASALLSSVRYVEVWHEQNASRAYVHHLREDLRSLGAVDLADGAVPAEVVDPLAKPDNTVSRLVSLLDHEASFPRATTRLAVVDDAGRVRQALIRPGVTSVPGPEPGCGWRVGRGERVVPLQARAFDFTWWVRIAYLSSGDSPVTVAAGDNEVRIDVDRGVGSIFLEVDGSLDEVRLGGLDPGVQLCVDTVEVGTPVPGGAPE